MPNPRANRPLTLDQVTADLKSFAQPAQALFDMMAGGLRGSAVGTFGAPGDIETLGRMGLNAAGGSFNPAMPSRSGKPFQPVSEEPYFPSSEELAKRFAPTIPNGDAVRQKSAEPFEEIGQFAPLPMSGKALKVLPYALGRGTGEVTKEAARMVNDAMIHQTGPLSQGPLSMLAPKGAVSHVFEPNPNWKTNTVNFGKPTPGIMIPSKMSNVREAVRDLKGNYGARRVERAADEIPNLERMFKEDALKEAFTGDNASAMITLSPAEFERYALELKGRTKRDIGPKMAELARQGDIDKYTVPMDEYIKHLQRVQGGFSDVPYLNLFKDEVGLPTMPKVTGHEGRHRSRALVEQGAPTSFVQINPRSDLREGLPRRTQEEFIEALKEELERSNRLVLPESDGPYQRPAIELPEPYAEGGSIHISDNPDTMMMEVGDKHMKDGGSEDDTKPFIGYPNLAKQARYARAVAPERGDVNLLKDPQTYAFAMGMLGEAPDELGFTVLDSDEQKQKIKAAGEKGFVAGAATQMGPLAQLGKKAGKKILSLAGEGINERMLSGRSLTPFVDTPAPVMFAVPPEKELTLPSKLPRAKPRSKEELRPLAQEMAEVTQGGFYKPDPSKSVNPAGKSFDQWKTEQGLVHDIRPTAKHQAIPRADIEKQKGMVKMGISGDTTVAEQVLHEAGPYALDIPSPQHGGALYGLGGEGAWASNNPIAANVQKRVNEISQAYDDAPVLGQYMQMGKLGSDFALHFADANLRAINLKKMSKDQIEMVNELIRKGSPKSGPRDSFPGIQDKDSAYLHFAVDPELRKHFNAIMQKPTYTEPLGLPDGRIIHHSITEPALRDLPVTTTGFSQMELHPGYDPEKLLLSEHPTYSHVIPHKPNTGLTRTQYHTPAQVEFPDVHEYLTKSGPRIYNTQDMTRMYQTSTPRQIIDQQHIDEIKMFEDLMKEYGGKKKGGAIKAKKDGQKFKPGKKPDQILKHGQAMPRGKDPEADISQMMPMMAGGGSINADDLILEERPL